MEREAYAYEGEKEVAPAEITFDSDQPIYTDGSCYWPTSNTIAAAGFACWQRTSAGTINLLYGNVPDFLPQTAAMRPRLCRRAEML